MWQIITMLFVRKSHHGTLEFVEMAGVFSKLPYFPSLEVHAVIIFNMIRKGQYEQAYVEVSRCAGESTATIISCSRLFNSFASIGLVQSDSSNKHSVIASMLAIYKFILQLYATNFEIQEQSDHQMAIETFLSESYLLPLIAEVCIVSLARFNGHTKKTRLNDKAKLEKFIYRYFSFMSHYVII